MKKTIGELIDELSIVNCKIYHLVEKQRQNKHTAEDWTKSENLNIYRSKLKNAINKEFNQRQEIKI